MAEIVIAMLTVIILVLIVFISFVIGGVKEKEKTVRGFARIDRSVGAKLDLMMSVLKGLVVTPSVIVLILTLSVSLAGMSVLSMESATHTIFTMPAIKASGNVTIIKLAQAVPTSDALYIVNTLLLYTQNRNTTITYYLVTVAEHPLRIAGVRTPKLVVVGTDSCCDGEYLILCETLDSPSPPFFCADEETLTQYLTINNVSILPIEAFVGNRPIFPPLTSVIVSSIEDASRLLGYDNAMVNTIVMNTYIPRSSIRGELTKSVSEVIVASNRGALVFTSERVSSIEEVIESAILSIAVSVTVYSASRSLIPKVKEIAQKLMISGFPSWGELVIYYVIVTLSLAVSIIAYSVVLMPLSLQLGVGHIILLSAFALAALAFTPKGEISASHINSDTSSFSAKVAPCDIDKLLSDIAMAIKRSEFFVVEEITIKKSGKGAFIRSRSIFSETWGIGVDITVFVNASEDNACLVHVSASDWSIEEISARLTESVRSLALSRIKSVVELWRLGYSR